MSEDVFTVSPSGATKSCNSCGTTYDLHGVDLEDQIYPVGDGCPKCAPLDTDLCPDCGGEWRPSPFEPVCPHCGLDIEDLEVAADLWDELAAS